MENCDKLFFYTVHILLLTRNYAYLYVLAFAYISIHIAVTMSCKMLAYSCAYMDALSNINLFIVHVTVILSNRVCEDYITTRLINRCISES